MINFLKKHKYKLLTLMFAIVGIFTFFLGINNTYAWSIDNDGNIVSDNLFNSQSKETNVITFEFNGSELILSGSYSGSGDLYYGFNLLSDLELNQSYSISFTTDNTNILYDTWINGSHYFVDYDSPLIIDNLTSNLKNADWRFVLPCGNYNNTIIKIMINKGMTPLSYEPYGIFYSSQNYNALLENGISSIIKNSLNGTTAKLFALNDRYIPTDNLSYYINNSGVYQEVITYNNSSSPYYSLSSNNPNINHIIYDDYTSYFDRYGAIFYSFSVPVSIDSLIFERGDTTGTRYINIWFNDNSMTQLTIDEGSDNRRYVIFTNTERKLITNILCTAEGGFNAVDSFSVPNSTAIYSSGFDTGYNNGYNDGLDNGYENGIKANNSDSYNRGYNDGAYSNLENSGMRTLFNSILSYPVNMIKTVFDFEFMGINISSLIMFIISIGIVAFVIKKFL